MTENASRWLDLSQPVLGMGTSVGMRASNSTASTQRPKARRQASKGMAWLRRCSKARSELSIMLITKPLELTSGTVLFITYFGWHGISRIAVQSPFLMPFPTDRKIDQRCHKPHQNLGRVSSVSKHSFLQGSRSQFNASSFVKSAWKS